MTKKIQKGFTLIEILVVIGIIAILAAVVLIAINPARQFAQARDSQRNSNLNAILNAVGQRIADNKGTFSGNGCPALPTGSTTTDAKDICSASTGCPDTGVDLSCLVPTYLPAFPIDPSGPTPPITGYKIYQDNNGRIHVLATTPEPNIPRTDPIEIVR